MDAFEQVKNSGKSMKKFTNADVVINSNDKARRASRGHEAARSEKLLRLLSDRAQTLHNDRTFYSKQSYRFCFFHFNGFWRGNDVTVLKANFQLSLMAQKVYDSERTH